MYSMCDGPNVSRPHNVCACVCMYVCVCVGAPSLLEYILCVHTLGPKYVCVCVRVCVCVVQVPWQLYMFPEFPYPPHLKPTTRYPKGEDVMAYVQAYADHFHLHTKVRAPPSPPHTCTCTHARYLNGEGVMAYDHACAHHLHLQTNR
jgi:hypothetical protein